MTLAGNDLRTYKRAPITFVAGEGCELIDDRGNRYLDCIAGIAVCALGHAHPAIADAVAAQARRLVARQQSRTITNRQGRLRASWRAGRAWSGVFFCNSGTEANEAAIKLARKYAYRRGDESAEHDPGMYGFVSRAHARLACRYFERRV